MKAEERIIPKFKPHSVSSLRKIDQALGNGEISFSRAVELLNIEAERLHQSRLNVSDDELANNKIFTMKENPKTSNDYILNSLSLQRLKGAKWFRDFLKKG